MKLCSHCNKNKVRAKGLCNSCYQRKNRTGSLLYEHERCFLCKSDKIYARKMCLECFNKFKKKVQINDNR